MFQSAFQAGAYLEILDVKGSKDKDRNEDKLFRTNNANGITKLYDKAIKSYLFEIDSSMKTKIQFPRDEKQELGLTQRFLVFQIFIPFESSFSLETIITDTSKNKRRLIFTSNIKDIEKTHFHTKIPLDTIKKGVWLNLSFDLVSFFCLFTGSTFRSLDGFIITGACKLRKILTMKNPLIEFSSCDEEASLPYLDNQSMNKTLNFAPGITYTNQNITYSSIQRSLDTVKDISPQSKAGDTSIRINTESFHLAAGYGSSTRLQEKDSLSPIKKKPRRNISLNVADYKTAKDPENKENTSVSPLRKAEPATSCSLLSTGDDLRSHKLGRRIVCSPTHNQTSFEKLKGQARNKTPTLEELISPKSAANKEQRIFVFKLPSGSIERKNPVVEEKKKIMSLVMKNSSKTPVMKTQEIPEFGDKIPLLAKKPRGKISTGSYFLNELSPKAGDITPKSVASSVKAGGRNPWRISEISLLSAKNLRSTIEPTQESPLRLVETSERKGLVRPKKIEEKLNSSSVRKDTMNTKTTQATSKDFSNESDRFSTFYKSREENPWFNGYKENDSLRPPVTINDDIESIEENLEYEVNSNTSGVCGSRNMLEPKNKKILFDQETDSVIDRRERNIGTPDLYRMFTGARNDDVSVSTDLMGRFERKSIYKPSKMMSEAEEGKARKKLNQLEEKVKNIVTNSRPFSPPFASKIIKKNMNSQMPDQDGLSGMLDVKEISSLNKFWSNNKLSMEIEDDNNSSSMWKQFYGPKKI